VDVIVRGPIEVAPLLGAVQGDHLGGTVIFLGSVRAGPDDGPVDRIEYTAYEEMVGVEAERIVHEAERRWAGAKILVRHRLGLVPRGEPSIAVVAACAHRAEAFEACRYVVDEAKKRLPVWKQEFMEDGGRRWRANAPEARGA